MFKVFGILKLCLVAIVGLLLIAFVAWDIPTPLHSEESHGRKTETNSTSSYEGVAFGYFSVDGDGEWLENTNATVQFVHAERRRNYLDPMQTQCWVYVIPVSEDMAEIDDVDFEIATPANGILFGDVWMQRAKFEFQMLQANCATGEAQKQTPL